MARADHWEAAYSTLGVDGVSWYQAVPDVSLELVAALEVPRGGAVIDVGGGASFLVDELVARDFRDVTVLDLSTSALEATRRRLPADVPVRWVEADVLEWEPDRRYDLWHDRAVFHFLVAASDRERYVTTLRRAVAPGGKVIVGAFAEDGPEMCSGLPVSRYSGVALGTALGDAFDLQEARREHHVTPRGAVQPFTWVAGSLESASEGRRRTLDDLLEAAQAGIDRLPPSAALAAVEQGALLIDIRADFERIRDGIVPGSLHIPRTVLEWRLDPDSPWRSPHVAGLEQRVVLLCDHGCSSVFAAATLAELGFANASDVIGGFAAWREAGLPTAAAPQVEPGAAEWPGMRPPDL